MRAHELPAAAASTRPAGLAQWTLGFSDMPLEYCESTDGLQRPHLLSTLPSPANQVITINPALPVEAAEDSAKKVRQAFQGDSILLFDLLILGVGPDGHTCSLLPGHSPLQERENLVAPPSATPQKPHTSPVEGSSKCRLWGDYSRQGRHSEARFGRQEGKPAPRSPGPAPSWEILLVPGRGSSLTPDRECPSGSIPRCNRCKPAPERCYSWDHAQPE